MKTDISEDFKRFCKTTSAHGFSYLTVTSNTTKLCWLLVLLLAFSSGIIHLYYLVTEYLKYDYHEAIIINDEVSPIFPDVTVCDNTGMVDSSLSR